MLLEDCCGFIEEVVGILKYCCCKEKIFCKFDVMEVNFMCFSDLVGEICC